MSKGQIFIIVLKFAAVFCQYEYSRPFKLLDDDSRVVLNTQDWDPNDDGERCYVLGLAKNTPNICSVRFTLDPVYLNCANEYIAIDGRKICGRLGDFYDVPYGKGEWNLRYRGVHPLEIKVYQKECKENYQTCDVTIRSSKAEIISPNYPDSYPALLNCMYTILPVNDAICKVSIHFDDFDVEDSQDCRKDRLLIGSEPFCGRIRNYRVVKNLTNSLIMRFKSDSFGNNRGFRLLVEQIHCGNTLKYTVEECCRRDLREPYMIITSPGFLTQHWTESNCQYIIYQSQPNFCQLRFRFRHFWVGDDDVFYGCVNGHLEIDRRRFCGCLDGYEYVSRFENGRKELLYTHRGPGNRGFLIEIFQEECETEYPFTNTTDTDPNTEIEIFRTNATSEKAVSRFLVPKEAARCYYWNHPGWVNEVRSFLKNAPVPAVCEENGGFPVSQFYPDEGPVPNPEVPVYPFPGFPTPDFPDFPPFVPPIFPQPNCIIFNNIMGQFNSPGYPGYANNLRVCYAFQAIPGFCRLEIIFRRFDLEKSFKCWKDYLLIGRDRFCGTYLNGRSVIMNFEPVGYIKLLFSTDGCFSRRGFLAVYRYIPCFQKLKKINSFNNSSELIDEK